MQVSGGILRPAIRLHLAELKAPPSTFAGQFDEAFGGQRQAKRPAPGAEPLRSSISSVRSKESPRDSSSFQL
jgi:hypothetical protein